MPHKADDNGARLCTDWRTGESLSSTGRYRKVWYCIRESGEAALTQLMAPSENLQPQQQAILAEVILRLDSERVNEGGRGELALVRFAKGFHCATIGSHARGSKSMAPWLGLELRTSGLKVRFHRPKHPRKRHFLKRLAQKLALGRQSWKNRSKLAQSAGSYPPRDARDGGIFGIGCKFDLFGYRR